MRKHLTDMLGHVRNGHLAAFANRDTMVTNLATALSIKRGLVQNDKPVLAFVKRINFRTIF